LFADEFEQYISVKSIATTGTDIDGTLQPFLYCRLARNPPIYGLAGFASTRLLGNSPIGWRFPAAVFGLLTIGLLFLIVRELTQYRAIALAAALLLAIEPLHIHFSRIGWEPATVLPFLLGTLWLLLIALREASRQVHFTILAAGAVLLGLTPYTYAATPMYAALLIASLLALHSYVFRSASSRRKLLAAAAIALAIASPALWAAARDAHTVKRATNIFTFANGLNDESLQVFIHNYASHFSWPYLFITGSPEPRYLSGYGLLHWWYAPLIVVGALFAHRYVRSRALYWWLWIWLAIYPLGGAITNDGVPHAARTIAGTPALCIFAAFGAYALIVSVGGWIPAANWRRRYQFGLLTVLAACALGSVWSFSGYYFGRYPILSAGAWESGAAEAFAAVRERQSGYRRLCLFGFNYYHVGSFERYYLPNTRLTIFEGLDHPECFKPSTLLLGTGLITSPGFQIVGFSRSLNGKTFAVLESRADAGRRSPQASGATEGHDDRVRRADH
jgi:4-amino-4-deoxy-L-arabinose transferase-like glycosyltransferase